MEPENTGPLEVRNIFLPNPSIFRFHVFIFRGVCKTHELLIFFSYSICDLKGNSGQDKMNRLPEKYKITWATGQLLPAMSPTFDSFSIFPTSDHLIYDNDQYQFHHHHDLPWKRLGGPNEKGAEKRWNLGLFCWCFLVSPKKGRNRKMLVSKSW